MKNQRSLMGQVHRLWQQGLIAEQTGVHIAAVRSWTYNMPGGPSRATP
jgi:hypothetical protein